MVFSNKAMFFEYVDGSYFRILVPGDGTLTFDGEFRGTPARETVNLLHVRQVSPGVQLMVWRESANPCTVVQIQNFNTGHVTSTITTPDLNISFLEGRIVFR